MAQLRVYLFGRFRVQYDDEPVTGLELAKVQELFCYLLLFAGRAHTRDKLIALLWDNHTAAQSRRYLRHALWQLHTALGDHPGLAADFLHVEPDWLHVHPTDGLWTDVWAFEQAFARAQGRPSDALDAEDACCLSEAVRLYGGDLLENWYQDWCIFERERLQSMYLTILDKLMDYHERHGNYEVGVSYGTHILRHDRARERTHRRLMRLHALAGDRTAALRQYRVCVRALQDELGVDPAQGTQRLYEQIRADRPPDALPTPPATPAPPTPTAAVDSTPAALLAELLHSFNHLQTILHHIQHQVDSNIESLKGLL